MAFADDLVLIAVPPVGLQSLLDGVSTFLHQCILEANVNKGLSITFPQQKKVAVHAKYFFTIKGMEKPALQRRDQWKHLG